MLLVISIFSVSSFAASGGISTSTLREQYGVAYSIAGGFTVADNGFSSSTTQATSALPCAWTNGGIRGGSMPVEFSRFKLEQLGMLCREGKTTRPSSPG